jgi:hypothetical protein
MNPHIAIWTNLASDLSSVITTGDERTVSLNRFIASKSY